MSQCNTGKSHLKWTEMVYMKKTCKTDTHSYK